MKSQTVQRAVSWLTVPKRPRLEAPQFGEWFKDLRGTESYGETANKIRPFVQDVGLKLDRSAIKKLEQGRVPSWPMLGGISRAYRVPIADTVAQLINALGLSSDLSRHTGTPSSAFPPGGGVDTTSTREIAELKQRIADYESLVREMQDVAGRLFRLAATGEKGRAAPGAQRQRGGRPRKAS